MFSTILITFRETLEAALIIGIVMGFLNRTKQTHNIRYVYYGTIAGIAASVIGAIGFSSLFGGFEGRSEEIFEGIFMLIGAGLITTVILWLGQTRQQIESEVSKAATPYALFSLVFVSVLREGVETVLFLAAAAVSSGFQMTGAAIGIVVAVMAAYGLFRWSGKLKTKSFFDASGILLLLFAAGLVAHGVHELQEAGIIPIIIEHLWDVNWILSESSQIGEVMKGLFGYNGNPSLLETAAYIAYLVPVSRYFTKTKVR